MKKVLMVLSGLLILVLVACDNASPEEAPTTDDTPTYEAYENDYPVEDIVDDVTYEESTDVENSDSEGYLYDAFIGSWENVSFYEVDADGNILTNFFEIAPELADDRITFYEDGTMSGDSEWRVEDNRLMMIFGGVSLDSFYFEFDGDILTLTAPPRMGNEYIIRILTRVR